MGKFDKLANVCLVIGSLLFFTTYSAHAYIDPGIGSFVFQLLIAGLVGASFLIKIFWRRIVKFFKKNVLKQPVEEESTEEDE